MRGICPGAEPAMCRSPAGRLALHSVRLPRWGCGDRKKCVVCSKTNVCIHGRLAGVDGESMRRKNRPKRQPAMRCARSLFKASLIYALPGHRGICTFEVARTGGVALKRRRPLF